MPVVVNTVIRLLMTGSKSVRNMYNSLPNKVEKECISLAFIIRLYHDARSCECQTKYRFICFTILGMKM